MSLDSKIALDRVGSFWQRLKHGVMRCYARPDWESFAGIDWPTTIMQAEMTDDFHAKQGRSTGRWILRAERQTLAVYLKRHYRLSWWSGLAALLWPNGNWSPALQELRHLEWATEQGFPVPKVVAGGEIIGPGTRLQSFLAVEELTDMLALHQAVPLASQTLPPLVFRRWKAGLLREMARLSRELHQRSHFHKDLYLCHFYVHRSDIQSIPATWRGRVHLIDLHRLGHHPLSAWIWKVKDLGQLLFSSDVEGVDDRDRVRFWRAYLGAERRSWRGRLLARLVLMKGGRYQAHNRKLEERSTRQAA